MHQNEAMRVTDSKRRSTSQAGGLWNGITRARYLIKMLPMLQSCRCGCRHLYPILAGPHVWHNEADQHRGPIRALFTDIRGPDFRDICYATHNRKFAVREQVSSWTRSGGGGRQQLQLEQTARDRHRGRVRKLSDRWWQQAQSGLAEERQAVGITPAPPPGKCLLTTLSKALRPSDQLRSR